MDNFNEVNGHIERATEVFTLFVRDEVNKTLAEGKFLTLEQLKLLTYRNARAEQAKTLRAAIAESGATTKEQLIEVVQHSLNLAETRVNLANDDLQRVIEEDKLGFLQMALYNARKTEEDEEREFKEFMSGNYKKEEY